MPTGMMSAAEMQQLWKEVQIAQRDRQQQQQQDGQKSSSTAGTGAGEGKISVALSNGLAAETLTQTGTHIYTQTWVGNLGLFLVLDGSGLDTSVVVKKAFRVPQCM